MAGHRRVHDQPDSGGRVALEEELVPWVRGAVRAEEEGPGDTMQCARLLFTHQLTLSLAPSQVATYAPLDLQQEEKTGTILRQSNQSWAGLSHVGLCVWT